jgi:tetratricopeptide (TPR) repeat protein
MTGRSTPSRDRLVAAALTVALLAIYAAGACPTIYVGDSGELVAAVHLLGIPHPTGYPLYVLLGKLWTLLFPFGSIAARMSIFSAVCAAAACGLLYRLGRRLDLHPLAALLAALLLAFSPSFWGEANVQRVYSLNALFVVLATTEAFDWYQRRRPRSLVLAFFLCGLGATNHTVMAVYGVALLSWVVLVTRGRDGWARIRKKSKNREHEPRFRTLVSCALAFTLGLLPYAYLPLRSRMDPALDWGNPETLEGFLDSVLRRGFWQRAWIESPSDLLVIAGDYSSSFQIELGWAGVALALLGLVAWRVRGGLLLLPLLVMAGNLAALALHGSRSDIFIWHRYYVPSYTMAALFAGLGCHALLSRLPPVLRWLPLALPALMLAMGWREFDRSRYRIAEEFSVALLRSLPPGAHLIATDDNILFVLIYLHLVEQHRPDVNLILQGVGDADLPPLRFNPETEPLFLTHHPNWDLPQLDIVPLGIVFQARRAGQPLPPMVLPLTRLPGEDDPLVPKDYLTQNLVGHFHYMIGFSFEQRDWLRSRAEFDLATAASPDNDVLFYNLGLVYQRNGMLEDAVRAFQRSHEINPRVLARKKPTRSLDRLAELAAEQRRLAQIEADLAEGSPLDALPRGTPAHHRLLAELLAARGENVAARGHQLRAIEIEAGRRRAP